MKKLLKLLGLWVLILAVSYPAYAGRTRIKDKMLMDDVSIGTLVVGTSITMPAKIHRIPIPLGSVMVDTVGPIKSDTSPSLTTTDNVPAIVWDNSTETLEIQFGWYPDSSLDAMSLKAIVTSDQSDGSKVALAWNLWVHGNDQTIPTSATAQTSVTASSTTLDGSEELLTLTLNSTGLAAITKGTSACTISLRNAQKDNTYGNVALEIKKLWIEETRQE